jgi:hypothetical protein
MLILSIANLDYTILMKEESISVENFQIDSLFNIFSHWDHLNESTQKV